MSRTMPPIATMFVAAGLLAVPSLVLGQANSPSGAMPTTPGTSMPGTVPGGAPGTPPLAGAAPQGSMMPGTMPGGMTQRGMMDGAQRPGAGTVAIERQRMSQVIGSRVYNERNESIGEVEDVLLRQDSAGPLAVIQVGGFLGIGGRLVSVPLSELRWNAERERIILPGGTREQLQARPVFNFDDARRT